MEIRLEIEDAIEIFGRDKIGQWITQGMQIEHKFQVRQQLGFEKVRAMSFNQQHELMQLNVRVGNPVARKKRKAKLDFSRTSAKDLEKWLNKILSGEENGKSKPK